MGLIHFSAADPSGENVTEIPENDLVVLHYFDNQAIGLFGGEDMAPLYHSS